MWRILIFSFTPESPVIQQNINSLILSFLATELYKYWVKILLFKIWNNLPLELKRSTSINLFKNKILKPPFDKYLLKCNWPNCFSCKQWYQLINKLVHAYFLWKNTWKYIRFYYQITVNDLNCVPKCKNIPGLVHKPIFPQASIVLCN